MNNNELFKYLSAVEHPISRDLLKKLEHVQQFALPIFTEVERSAREHSDRHHHPLLHATEVGNLCAQLLPKHKIGEQEHQVNAVEIMVLLASAWLHEVGLNEPGAENVYNVFSARAVWDKETEHTRVAGLDSVLASAVADICLAHRDHIRGNDIIRTLRPGALSDRHWNNFRIRIPLLAALFRTAFLLEVHHHRRTSDCGLQSSLEINLAWVKDGPITHLPIDAELGTITVTLSEPAQSSDTLRDSVQSWCERVNQEFNTYIKDVFADYKLAYRDRLVIPPSKGTDGESHEEKIARSLQRFRCDAEGVVALRNELGLWTLRTGGDGFPFLHRTIIDYQGRNVELQIAPDIHYPDEPPIAKAYPRIERVDFRDTGYYEDSAIHRWKDLTSRGDALEELCEELRHFESAERTFATHARMASRERRHAHWIFSDERNLDSCRLTYTVELGKDFYNIHLLTHPSYPLWPPHIEGLKELEVQSGVAPRIRKQLIEQWRNNMVLRDAPLEVLLDWLDLQLNALKSAASC